MAVIKTIGDLKIPPTLSGNAEQFNADSTRRTVSQRMITKLSPTEKWRITLDYGSRAVMPEFQHKLYAKIASMRKTSDIIVFENPKTGEIVSARMRTIQAFSPKIVMHDRVNPKFYSGAGAVFEEV